MNKLNIIKNENGNDAVLCSTLYKGLGLQTTNYKNWIEKNITNNKFAIEGDDFIKLSYVKHKISNYKTPLTYHNGKVGTRNRERKQDFVLTLSFAKRLAMQCPTEKGEAVRQYFLECERMAKAKESEQITLLKQKLSIYEKMELVRNTRIELNRQMRELKTSLVVVKQLISNQLTLNFTYEN
ncbi:antA/AntB antirepressor family protein [Flavobacterium psychrophilum]|nr:antA/AntB antirepressor family protein [Flavobacterium psychrophilum]